MRRHHRRPAEPLVRKAGGEPTEKGEIRRRARTEIELGPITASYGADPERVSRFLNEDLATEIVCVLRYMHDAYVASGIHSDPIAKEFRDHALSEQEHADRLAKRIVQLGGKPELDPRGMVERSATEYVEAGTIAEMLRENLVAERIVIERYTEQIRSLGDDDPTTRNILEDILEDEEEHAHELRQLLKADPSGELAPGSKRSHDSKH